jgi:hypothetical protein
MLDKGRRGAAIFKTYSFGFLRPAHISHYPFFKHHNMHCGLVRAMGNIKNAH